MDIIITDLSKNLTVENKKEDKKEEKKDNCQELKNIAYKTMLLNGTDINPKNINHSNNEKISSFLENESSANKKETWSKLDKTQKVIRLHNYAESLDKQYDLSDEEIKNLKNYLVRCLDRKCLLKSKEVTYDKDNNKITNIPFLFFNKDNRVFILKKDDKHVSTIKSLPPEKKNRAKTVKNHNE